MTRMDILTSHFCFSSSLESKRELLEQSCSLFWPSRLPVLESNRFSDTVSFVYFVLGPNIGFKERTELSPLHGQLIKSTKGHCVHLTLFCTLWHRYIRSLCTVVCKWTYCPPDGWDSSFWISIGLPDLVENNFSKIGNGRLKLVKIFKGDRHCLSSSTPLHKTAFSAIQAVWHVLQGALWVRASPRRPQQIWVCTQELRWVLRSLTLMPEALVWHQRPVYFTCQTFIYQQSAVTQNCTDSFTITQINKWVILIKSKKS